MIGSTIRGPGVPGARRRHLSSASGGGRRRRGPQLNPLALGSTVACKSSRLRSQRRQPRGDLPAPVCRRVTRLCGQFGCALLDQRPQHAAKDDPTRPSPDSSPEFGLDGVQAAQSAAGGVVASVACWGSSRPRVQLVQHVRAAARPATLTPGLALAKARSAGPGLRTTSLAGCSRRKRGFLRGRPPKPDERASSALTVWPTAGRAPARVRFRRPTRYDANFSAASGMMSGTPAHRRVILSSLGNAGGRTAATTREPLSDRR